jgi:heme oxygenase
MPLAMRAASNRHEQPHCYRSHRMNPASTLHQKLRQATKPGHHALDHHPLLAPLVSPALNIVQYGNALAAMHGVYSRLEPNILAFLDNCLFDYRPRLKLPGLEADLAWLGRTPIPAGVNFLVPQTIPELIGILYAVEGSTQGGQVIARILRELSHVRLPMQFFSGYGDNSNQRWEEFLEFAETFCPADKHDAAVASAATLFEAIKDHLDFAANHLGGLGHGATVRQTESIC